MTGDEIQGTGPSSTEPRWLRDLPYEVFLPPVGEATALLEWPEGFLSLALKRAKWWFKSQTDIKIVRGALNLAKEYDAAARENASKFGVLDATEILRRAEHRLGQMIIDGQEAGVFTKRNDTLGKIALKDFFGLDSRSAINALRDPGKPSTDDFEAAVELGRADWNLSLANVTRLVKGLDLETDRSEWNYGKRRVDSNKIITALADQLDADISGLDLVDRMALDPVLTEESKQSIRKSIAVIQKEMKKW